MKTNVYLGFVVVVVAGLVIVPASAALTPATFDEYAGIAWYGIQGTSRADAESVGLTVTLGQTDNRGGGTATASASNVLPLPAELDMAIYGGTNISGIGATAYVLTRHYFSLDPLPGGQLGSTVPFTLAASGWVTVDSSLPDGSIGTTFARISYPWGQWEARNEDAYGGHNGHFSFDQSVPLSGTAGVSYQIDIYLHSHGQGSGSTFFYNSHAFLDPVIEIDPAFRDNYRVVYSGNVIVPEPSTLALLGVGAIGLIGWWWRRRQLA
jgi:hypothetical protein